MRASIEEKSGSTMNIIIQNDTASYDGKQE